jgi:hypothetical protein
MNWKTMKPTSLEDYAAQRMQDLADTPVDIDRAALAEPPWETVYASYQPDRLQDRFRTTTRTISHGDVETARRDFHKTAPPGAEHEILSFYVDEPDGKLRLVQPPGKPSVRYDRRLRATAETVEAPPPPGARFGVHNHRPGHTRGFIDENITNGGYGDSSALALSNPIPMLTVARPTEGPFRGEDVIGVHEMVNGQLIFRVPRGAMTDQERAEIQRNLDRAQRKFYK